ncbi:MAG: Arginine--tRNA ligase [Candidatus Omnitrophica bacterium ADurb.Bin314]|nr:MAG: Arginine--tRNA ligase [Candidatus Omnitrophica bacterium ADurb.Bin314]
MKSKIDSVLNEAIESLFKDQKMDLPAGLSCDLQPPRESSHGDLSTNVAFKLSKLLRKKPADIAEAIVAFIEELGENSPVEHAKIAGGGFINFSLRKADLGAVLVAIYHADTRYGASEYGKGKKVIVEFVSANPTGPLTIAHGRQAAVGDSLCRILKATGHEVHPEYYLNDAGRQMGLLAKSVWTRYNELLGLAMPLPEDGYKGDYIREIARDIIEKEKKDLLLKEPEDKAVEFCGHYAVKAIMGRIEEDLAKMGVHFDNYFSEKSLYARKSVERALEVLKQKGYLFENEGALWFRSTDFGDDKDRVVKKSTGEYTYLAPDIAYHLSKYERGYNMMVNFWGPDHHGYIPRLKAACQALGYSPEAIHIGIVQLTTLYREGQPVRMSTRAGEFVTLRELYEEVGVDATRFFFTMRRQESPLDFDLDLAKEQSQENPVYYLQYAHARIASLLKFSGEKVTAEVDLSLLSSKEETDLISCLSQFPDNLIAASRLLEPYRLADYLRQVAACFHKFYSFHRIVNEDKELTKSRLLLSDATRIVLRNGLQLLGISHPESM